MRCRPQFAFALAAALVLGGCVSLPLPPVKTASAEPGDWGSVKIMVTYVPNVGNLIQSYKDWKKPEQ
jgi:hypothetical protein